MKMNKIHSVFFSPTGHTKKVTLYIANRFEKLFAATTTTATKTATTTGDTTTCTHSVQKDESCKIIVDDITLPKERNHKREYLKNDFAIFAFPTYAGRIPNKLLPFLENNFLGKKTKAIALVTFGNRNYDSSLDELASVLSKNDFLVIGKIAICAKHAFAEIGKNRPSVNDFLLVDEFCDAAFEKLSKMSYATEKYGESVLSDFVCKNNEIAPYYSPLKEDGKSAQFLKAKPFTSSSCTSCMLCAKLCPMGAIDFSNPCNIPGVCIKCQSCVVHCPFNAKQFVDKDFLSHKKMLEKNYEQNAKSVYFV